MESNITQEELEAIFARCEQAQSPDHYKCDHCQGQLEPWPECIFILYCPKCDTDITEATLAYLEAHRRSDENH